MVWTTGSPNRPSSPPRCKKQKLGGVLSQRPQLQNQDRQGPQTSGLSEPIPESWGIGCGEKGMPSFIRTPSPCGPPGRSPGKETEEQGAPPTTGRYRHLPTRPDTFPLLGTHWPGLCSPGVGPAARRPVLMRPGCWSRVGSAGGISRPWARRAESQQRFAGSAPSMAQPAPPAARPRPPAALLPRPPPAAQTGCAGRQHRLLRLHRRRR